MDVNIYLLENLPGIVWDVIIWLFHW